MIITEENKMAKIAVNKSLLKEYQTNEDSRVVYMNDNTEFEIMLFNPETYNIGIEIYINENKLDGMLVLKPGQRCWLERYLNDNKKFKFSTYEVEDNNEHVKNAIRNNGNITVKFYRERNDKLYKLIDDNNYWLNHNLNEPLISKPLNNPSISPFVYKTTCINNTSSIMDDKNKIMNDTRLCSTSLLKDTVINTSGIETSASTLNASSIKSFSKSISSNVTNKLFETGRIEKGGYSNQKFESVHNDFDNYPYKSEYIKILPMSRKPYNVNDLNKVYCTNCGRKLNTKFKFCPYCGSKVEQI